MQLLNTWNLRLPSIDKSITIGANRVTAIILTYNMQELLVKCCQSLIAQSCINEIIIIDNASTLNLQGTYATITTMSAEHKVRIDIIYSKEQISFSKGQNLGIDKAQNDFILLMNNDAFFLEADKLQSSVQAMLQYPDLAIVGHKIVDSQMIINHAGCFYDILVRAHNHIGLYEADYCNKFTKPRWVTSVTAACCLIRRSSLRFDENYWFECEDQDYCYQNLFANKTILYNSDPVIVHNVSLTRNEKSTADTIWQQRCSQSLVYFKSKWKKLYWLLAIIDLPHNLAFHDRFYFSFRNRIGVFLLLFVTLVGVILNLGLASIFFYTSMLISIWCLVITLVRLIFRNKFYN